MPGSAAVRGPGGRGALLLRAYCCAPPSAHPAPPCACSAATSTPRSSPSPPSSPCWTPWSLLPSAELFYASTTWGWRGCAQCCLTSAASPRCAASSCPTATWTCAARPPGTDAGIRCLAAHLRALPALKELDLYSSRLSGRLRQLLGELQTPLESLALAFCCLLPSDLIFLSSSLHAPSLLQLDLSGHNLTSPSLLQPLRTLLEAASCSLLQLELLECQLGDAELELLLPALRRCRRLRCLGLLGTPLSAAALGGLAWRGPARPAPRGLLAAAAGLRPPHPHAGGGGFPGGAVPAAGERG
ncbi:leucine-rich repeat-containing protein 14B-like [Colius striatus]|uniref:leucine-rich repeat-containing protein 14B-like n=1 Tax=Colius striatus TaxID=57412 RepID=UPI002B1E8907|nr:leucine-rich repeat-containing protein 14B-like [Colius striatus]